MGAAFICYLQNRRLGEVVAEAGEDHIVSSFGIYWGCGSSDGRASAGSTETSPGFLCQVAIEHRELQAALGG